LVGAGGETRHRGYDQFDNYDIWKPALQAPDRENQPTGRPERVDPGNAVAIQIASFV